MEILGNGRFSGRIWPDWGNTAWADMARSGSIGLISCCLSAVSSHWVSHNKAVCVGI